MTQSQCLWYALDKWHAEGGYLVFRKSKHWFMPHVMHLSADQGQLSHFVPPDDLKKPWHSVGGFQGIVMLDDKEQAKPMSLAGMFVGTLLLMILGGVWVVRRWFK
jgi:hypothetical protein